MIYLLSTLPKEYGIILDRLTNHLMASGDNVLTIDIICEKLNHWYEKNENKKKEKNEKEKTSGSVVSSLTNLVIVNVWRIKKKMTMK